MTTATMNVTGLTATNAIFPQIGYQELVGYRPALLRFARRKVRDEALAEDAVQDTLVAALLGLDKFQGQSQLKTWLIGILNHKIQDAFRRESRFTPLNGATNEEGDEETAAEERLMDEDAIDPEQEVARLRMLSDLTEEVDRLPPNLRAVFQLQAIEDRSTDEVCQTLRITEANCWVRLHRARKRLTERLSHHF